MDGPKARRLQWRFVVMSNRLLARQGLSDDDRQAEDGGLEAARDVPEAAQQAASASPQRTAGSAAAPGASAPGAAVAADGRLTQHVLDDQGVQRRYVLYTPGRTPPGARRLPLLFLFHGGYGNGRRMAERVGMNAVANREGFLVVYPDAVAGHWNDGRSTTRSAIDDVAFVRRLLEHLARGYPVDRSRVYAAGISNGGAFAARLACEMSERLAAVAQVVSTMPEEFLRVGRPRHPVPVMMINGVDDPILPWEGGDLSERYRLGKGGPVVSAAEAVAFWVAHNGCTPTPKREVLVAGDAAASGVERISYADPVNGSRVELLAIRGGGHTWPGSPERPNLRHLVGPTSQDIDASQVIWEFLREHRRA